MASCGQNPAGQLSPASDNDTPVVRTDFSGDDQWKRLRNEVSNRGEAFQAYIDYIDDADYKNMTPEQVAAAYADQNERIGFLFIADEETLSDPEFPILVVDLLSDPIRTFRVVPEWIWAVENNLSLANMDWEDFADHTDADGVYRGGGL